MAKCKLTKPIRTTTETIIYVDDASLFNYEAESSPEFNIKIIYKY